MSEPSFYTSRIPIDDPVALAVMLRGINCLLLDFDGPVCSVFAGYPARNVAEEMRGELLAEALSLTYEGRVTDDPMEVLRSAAAGSTRGQKRAEELLEAAENRCVDTAEPTPGAADLLRAAAFAKITVIVVSNNGQAAIRRYLVSHGLVDLVHEIVGRNAQDATLMKPHPHLLLAALTSVGSTPEGAIFLGDSVSDIDAAHAARVRVLAYANRAEKEPDLLAAAPDGLVRHLEWITQALETGSA